MCSNKIYKLIVLKKDMMQNTKIYLLLAEYILIYDNSVGNSTGSDEVNIND